MKKKDGLTQKEWRILDKELNKLYPDRKEEGNIMLNKEEKKVEKIITNNMKEELKHLDWFFGIKPKAFNRTIDNMLEEIHTLRELYKGK